MSEAVIVAIITGLITLSGTALTVVQSNKKTDVNFKIAQAEMKKDIEELTREVRQHNGFAQRMPVVEEQIKVINHRLEDLEDVKK